MTKPLDLICIGLSSVDVYAQQYGSRLEDVASFNKYIGSSSTNIAACSARMGLKSALITRVGDEHLGRFVRENLQREGVNTDYVVTDPDRFTALVFLGIKDKNTFPKLFLLIRINDYVFQNNKTNSCTSTRRIPLRSEDQDRR